MQSGISFQSLKTGLFFLFIFSFGCSVHAAQFTADLTITAPESEVVYDLKVKDNMYRIEKVKGLLFLPSLPTIYNRITGISWGLNPQMNQYVEQTDPAKTMMINPIAGWEFMRRNLEGTPTGTETIEGYSCQILEYRQHGDTRVANRVWVSPELGFTLKEVSYALNGDATLALKNIKKGPVDPALFEIPPGYSKVVMEKAPRGDNTKSNAKKSAKAKKPLSKILDVKRMSGHGISLEQDRHIIITATGNSPGGSVSSAHMKVLDEGNNEILTEKITLQNGEIRTWELTPDKNPWTLSLSGEKGLIKFKVDQLADEPSSTLQTPQAPADKQMPTSAPEERVVPGNLMFILDASGSMWGQVEGTAKIVIAKKVLTDIIQELPDDTVAGLVAYGHRRKGDCNDVEELITLGTLNKQAMIVQVQKLNPKGKTPISRSVRLTAERIKHIEDETTIILVSDGKETCDPDPCGLVKDLKASGIKFIMHVIGFDVTEEEREQLECMAQAGGGTYYTAGNAKDFQLAAQDVVKKASEKPPVSLKVTSVKDGKPFKTYVQILTPGGEKGVADGWTSEEKPVAFRLPPGTYDIRAQDRDVIQRPTVDIKNVKIVEGQLIEKAADFTTEGIVRVKAVKKNVPIQAQVWVSRQQDNASMGARASGKDGSPVEYKLLPGMYKIEVQDRSVSQRPVVSFENVEVKAGETTERVATFDQEGILRVKAVKNNIPIQAQVWVSRQQDNASMGARATGKDGSPVEYKLLPGMYKVKFQDRSVSHRPVVFIENVEVKAGETTDCKGSFGE